MTAFAPRTIRSPQPFERWRTDMGESQQEEKEEKKDEDSGDGKLLLETIPKSAAQSSNFEKFWFILNKDLSYSRIMNGKAWLSILLDTFF